MNHLPRDLKLKYLKKGVVMGPGYELSKTITKGISGGIRGAIFGGGTCAVVGGESIETIVSSLVCTLLGFLYSAGKNWLKNK